MKEPEINKKKFEEIRKLFKAELPRIGAVLIRDEPVYEKIIKLVGLDFEMETKAGKLGIHPTETGILCRFKDVEAAKKILPHYWTARLNPASGKYNFEWYPSLVTRDHIRVFFSTLMNDGLIEINRELLK
ncbi:MAG TPA: hypothetical protein PLP33_24900 [Leptospiraceae bacterium]|nr:hypothetical protein [Leptospiraceae bacterium]